MILIPLVDKWNIIFPVTQKETSIKSTMYHTKYKDFIDLHEDNIIMYQQYEFTFAWGFLHCGNQSIVRL